MSFEMIKLLCDGGVFLTLALLAYRLCRSPEQKLRTDRINDLSASLKELIQDAERAGRSLNDQLLKRQQSLEKLLFDFDGAENRLNRAITTAEERKGLLEVSVARAEAVSRTTSVERSEPAPFVSQAVEAPTREPVSRRSIRSYAESEPILSPEPPSFETAIRKNSVTEKKIRPGLSDLIEREYIPDSPAFVRQEPAKDSPQNPRVTVRPARTKNLQNSIEHIVTQAEESIEVASDLKNIEVIREETQEDLQDDLQETTDPRLGVLSAIKRQVQIL